MPIPATATDAEIRAALAENKPWTEIVETLHVGNSRISRIAKTIEPELKIKAENFDKLKQIFVNHAMKWRFDITTDEREFLKQFEDE